MSEKEPQYRPETLAVRAGQERSQFNEHAEALYLTSSFVFDSAAQAAARFAGEEEGNVYSRFTNPTVATFQTRLAALEGAEACVATSSGMSAILSLVMGLCSSGDHIVASTGLFGATQQLLGNIMARFGVRTTFVGQTDVAAWEAAIQPETRLFFLETPSNPLTEIADIAALVEVAHARGILVAVDNCFCTPILQRPAALGADLVIHSGTKHLDGQGRVMAGAICGPSKLIVDVFGPIVRTAGMALAPFNAWVVLKGIETLGVRMKAHCANALDIAQWLEKQPGIARVYYPGLASHAQHELAMQQQSGQGGAVVSFDVVGDTPETARANAFHVINSTRVVSVATNLGDVKTIITHPGTTSHGRLTEAQRQAAGIGQGLIRLAVGLEHAEDIKADLLRGLSTLNPR